MKYWSLSNWLKQNTKKALNYINSYEDHLSEYCQTNNYDAIICGHIHVPVIKKIGTIDYLNCGDWVESGTAILEHHDGKFELMEFQQHEKNTSDN
jgi:UDP-2,3-diacylglucosamine pyrophosphatase LpxH